MDPETELYVLRESLKLKNEITAQLDAQNIQISAIKADVTRIVGDGHFEGELPRISRTLLEFIAEQREANKAALAARRETDQKFLSLSSESAAIRTRLGVLNWIVRVTNDGKDLWKFLVGCSAVVVAVATVYHYFIASMLHLPGGVR